MEKGDKFIHIDIIGNTHELIYSGTRKEIKGCEFEFFYNNKGGCSFFTDEEVSKFKKID